MNRLRTFSESRTIWPEQSCSANKVPDLLFLLLHLHWNLFAKATRQYKVWEWIGRERRGGWGTCACVSVCVCVKACYCMWWVADVGDCNITRDARSKQPRSETTRATKNLHSTKGQESSSQPKGEPTRECRGSNPPTGWVPQSDKGQQAPWPGQKQPTPAHIGHRAPQTETCPNNWWGAHHSQERQVCSQQQRQCLMLLHQ